MFVIGHDEQLVGDGGEAPEVPGSIDRNGDSDQPAVLREADTRLTQQLEIFLLAWAVELLEIEHRAGRVVRGKERLELVEEAPPQASVCEHRLDARLIDLPVGEVLDDRKDKGAMGGAVDDGAAAAVGEDVELVVRDR